ncbi:MAG TPA: hypothetical protein VM733_09705 [Thermoanaerobaculia bacterium]|nr:hypothetical protein [Thermoanaerobaculia bacterium]
MTMTVFASLLWMATLPAMPSADGELERLREATRFAVAKMEPVRLETLTLDDSTRKHLEATRRRIFESAARIEEFVPAARKKPSLELSFALLNEAKVVDDLLEDMAEGLATAKMEKVKEQDPIVVWFRGASESSIRVLGAALALEKVLQTQLGVADARLATCGAK